MSLKTAQTTSIFIYTFSNNCVFTVPFHFINDIILYYFPLIQTISLGFLVKQIYVTSDFVRYTIFSWQVFFFWYFEYHNLFFIFKVILNRPDLCLLQIKIQVFSALWSQPFYFPVTGFPGLTFPTNPGMSQWLYVPFILGLIRGRKGQLYFTWTQEHWSLLCLQRVNSKA